MRSVGDIGASVFGLKDSDGSDDKMDSQAQPAAQSKSSSRLGSIDWKKKSVMRLSVLTHDVQNNSNGRPRPPPIVHATSAHRGLFPAPLSPTSSLTLMPDGR